MLSHETFQNPPSAFRGVPFWALNGKLEKETLVHQIGIMQEMGMGGFVLHARIGLDTDYMSPEFLSRLSDCVEEARSRGMFAWLYDEDRWPSGAAGGIVTKDVAMRARNLLVTPTPYGVGLKHPEGETGFGGSRAENGHLLACYDIVLNDAGELASYRRIAEDEPVQGTRWYCYLETAIPSPWFNGQTYPDTLNPEVAKRFIEATHEVYKQSFQEDFGGVIPSIFTDEPQFAGKGTLPDAFSLCDVCLPWTDALEDAYVAQYAESLLDHFPELLWELPDGKLSQTRYRYHDVITERFLTAFIDPLGAWCRENGLALSGHMMSEPSLESQTWDIGEAMRAYRAFPDMPGIDMLCDFREFNTAKQAQSAAHQHHSRGVMSELYGVTGWAFDFRGHKLQGDWQAALGITVRVPHLYWMQMQGESKRDYPASIGEQSAWYPRYHLIEDHFARVAAAMTRGEPVVSVAVIHPIESYWQAWGPSRQTLSKREALDSAFEKLTDTLLTGLCDFDFISESRLPDLCPEGDNPLQVGHMRYSTVIIPDVTTLRPTTIARLTAFKKAGGRLIVLGNAPFAEAEPLYEGLSVTQASPDALMRAIAPERLVDAHDAKGRRTDYLLHQMRQEGDDRWLFLARAKNPESPDFDPSPNLTIRIKGAWSLEEWDTATGQVEEIAARQEQGWTVFERVWHLQDSLLLRLTPGAAKGETPIVEEKGQSISVPVMASVTLSEPNMLLLDRAEYSLNGGAFQPAMEILRLDNHCRDLLGIPRRMRDVLQPYLVPKNPPAHTVTLRYTFVSDIVVEKPMLALEHAALCHITLHGVAVPPDVTGYFVDRTIHTVALPPFIVGENVLTVTAPLGERHGLEACYLLGDFGVQVAGDTARVVKPVRTVRWGDFVPQGLPFYTGNLTLTFPVMTMGGPLSVRVPHYRGALLDVSVDGNPHGSIITSPYTVTIPFVTKGEHEIALTLYGTRQNGFAPLHHTPGVWYYQGPNSFRSQGDLWTDAIQLTPFGVLKAPEIS